MNLKKLKTRRMKLNSRLYSWYLKFSGVKIGDDFLLFSNWKIYNHEQLIIGDNVFINDNFWCNAKGKVTISDNVLVGPNVVIHSSNHNYTDNNKLIRQQGHTDKSVFIGENVWIGAAVVILPGVTICPHVVIAAGSVVTKDINVSGVYGGIPSKFIKGL